MGGSAVDLKTWPPAALESMAPICTHPEPLTQSALESKQPKGHYLIGCKDEDIAPLGKAASPKRSALCLRDMHNFGKTHGQRGLAGYSPWGRRESDLT